VFFPTWQVIAGSCARDHGGNGLRRMADQNEIQDLVESAVAAVLAKRLPELQAELVRRVLEALPAPAAATPAPSAPAAGAGGLLPAVANIQASSTQKEILKTLLDGASERCARVALFVVKAGAGTGWQSLGFAGDDGIKDFSLDMQAGPVSHAYQNRAATPGNIAEMGSRFVEQFGEPSNEQILVVPLLLKDKVAALLYGDGGAGGTLDGSGLELLVMATGAWLEVVSLRKQSQKEGEAAEPSAPPPPLPGAAPTVSSFSDPFAGHAPKHIAPAAATPEADPEPATEVVEVAAAASASASSAAAPATAADPFAGLSAEEADTHRKAQRFSRLLVDEIKLYNQAKVAEGRRHKDLYDRLKSEIEKSRSTFQKRYGSTAAASGDYFQQEVVRSLAEDDLSVMGPNFKR
jgi:hypothetical protein